MPLSREDLYETWAPHDALWSPWAKPVLFAEVRHYLPNPPAFDDRPFASFGYARDAAIIVDVPGVESVQIGLALAQVGYRPVPLYNGAASPGSLVNMGVIADALAAGGQRLRGISLLQYARPAFLLNADRTRHGAGALSPGIFDNRWCVVPQDMPSATFLKSHGIKQVVLIAERVADDLAHVLYRYQDAGLDLRRFNASGTTEPLQVSRPTSYKSTWYRAAVFAGLRRNSAGGFGSLIPDPGEGGGG